MQTGVSGETRTYDLRLMASDGALIGEIEGFTLKRAPRAAFLRGSGHRATDFLYEIAWRQRSRYPKRVGPRTAIGWCSPMRTAWHRRLPPICETTNRRVCWSPMGLPPGAGSPNWTRPGVDLAGVVYLRGLDALVIEHSSCEFLTTQVRAACVGLLTVVQTLVKKDKIPKYGVWIATEQAQLIAPGESPAVAQSTLWGMGRVVQSEYPLLGCRLVDMDRAGAESLWREIKSASRETQVALRSDRRLAPVLRRASPIKGAPVQFSPVQFSNDAAYLITGGFGGIGLTLAGWLIRQGAQHLVLNGRSDPDERVRSAAAEWRNTGAEIDLIRADVSDEAEVSRLLASILRSARPLRGIFHLAGTTSDAALSNQSWPQMTDVLRPKLAAWNLHRASTELPLDWFVLFSSASAVLGTPGQANYSAANAFLSALAAFRRSRGLPATSIEWGTWGEVGMAARNGDRRRFERMGLRLMAPAQALNALEQILSRDASNTVAISAEWPLLARHLGGNGVPLLLEDLVAAPQARKNETGVLDRIRELPAEQRRGELTDFLRREVMSVLGMNGPPESSASLFELGMDSLLVVELRDRLHRELGDRVPVPYTVAFEYPTINAMANFFNDQLGESGSRRVPVAAAANGDAAPQADFASFLSRVSDLSNAEAEELLLKKLAQFGGA